MKLKRLNFMSFKLNIEKKPTHKNRQRLMFQYLHETLMLNQGYVQASMKTNRIVSKSIITHKANY